MMYILNNERKKGQSKKTRPASVEKQLPTQVVISSDYHSRYVFRADVCYDWDIEKEQIYSDIEFYREDHLNDFLSKNARFNDYGIHPMKPSPSDTETLQEYIHKLEEFNKRYVKSYSTNGAG